MMQGSLPPEDPARKDETMNSVFRVYKYPLNYAAFTGRDMTPGDFVEKYPTSVENLLNQGPSVLVYPNPFVNKIYLTGITGDETCDLFNSTGQVIWSGKQIGQQDFSALTPGVFFLKVRSRNFMQTMKLFKD
jgi:hypothetical protein